MRSIKNVFANQKEWIFLLLVLVCSLPSIYSLLIPGFMQTDDGSWMVIRFSAFYEALKDGQFPVRFLTRLNNGYGYPVATFLYPGFMYLGAPLKILGLSFLDVIKTIFAFSMVTSVLGMYFWLRSHFAKLESFIGALCYLYLPYHLYDLTSRGSIGELLALAVAPYLFLAIEKRKMFFTCILIAALILFHNTLALLFLGIFLLLFLIFQKKERRWIFLAYLWGVGLSAFFWLPAVFELPLTIFSKTSVSKTSEHFAPLEVIGVATLIIIVSCLLTFIQMKEMEKRITIYSIILMLSVFLSSQVSQIIWQILPGQLIQFPFRLLALAIFFAPFCVAFIIKKSPAKLVFSVVFIGVLLLSNSYFLPGGFDRYEDPYYSTNQATTTVLNEYMPVWVKKVPDANASELVKSQKGRISDISFTSRVVTFHVNSQIDDLITVNRLYYPGWTADVDGSEAKIETVDPYGVIGFRVAPGNHAVTVQFRETTFHLFADAITALSFLSLIFLMVKKKI